MPAIAAARRVQLTVTTNAKTTDDTAKQ